jgi:D-3-phosphoglycerate dehydrogenase
MNKYFIIDFDSTFTKVEGLDELADIALQDEPDRAEVLQAIKDITNKGMAGEISFSESLVSRIALLRANRKHLPKLVERLRSQVSESFKRNTQFLKDYADSILIISSGFREFIEPIVIQYGLKPENIYANSFLYSEEGKIVGCQDYVLTQDKGKVKLLQQLNLKGDVYVIGDGYTDFEIRESGLANVFYAFTENVGRERVMEKADYIAPSFEEFLYANKLPMAISYPKNRINVLLLENIHPRAVEIFRQEGYNVEIMKDALDEEELAERIQNISILGIRSKTRVTEKVLQKAHKLMLVGAFCIGTTQIDLQACAKQGIAVFNAPYSNTRSVVELAIGEMIMLMRNIPDTSAGMHVGKWNKSATGSREIRGKKLGIIGYGNIGTQLSVLAEALGMEVYYYDLVEKLALGNAKRCHTLKELLSIADVVTLHVDDRPTNKNFIRAEHFEMMKDGVIFINLSRGFVVDVPALAAAVRAGKVRGASADVFPYEPKGNNEEFVSELRGLPNFILTPHIGGSTEEAQENIAQFVPSKVLQYVNKGDTFGSVNFPNLQLPEQQDVHRLLHIHYNTSGILAHINQVLAKNDINILGQYLKTTETIGYVITDIDKEYNKEVIQELRQIPNTIKFRILY